MNIMLHMAVAMLVFFIPTLLLASEKGAIVYDGKGSPLGQGWRYASDGDVSTETSPAEMGKVWSFDQPGKGFLFQNSLGFAADSYFWHETGYLDETGFTMLIRVKNARTVGTTRPGGLGCWIDLGNGSAVLFSITDESINIGQGGSYKFKTNDGEFHTYRIVGLPKAETVDVYLDEQKTPVIKEAKKKCWIGTNAANQSGRLCFGDYRAVKDRDGIAVWNFVKFHTGAMPPAGIDISDDYVPINEARFIDYISELKLKTPKGSIETEDIFGMTDIELINNSAVLRKIYKPLKVVEFTKYAAYPDSKEDVAHILKTGDWKICNSGFAAAIKSSSRPGDAVEFDFYGTRLDLMAYVNEACGAAKICIDGITYFVSLRRPYVRAERITVASGLCCCVHRVRIETIKTDKDFLPFNIKRMCPSVESYAGEGELISNPIILSPHTADKRKIFYADCLSLPEPDEVLLNSMVAFDILDLNDHVVMPDVKPGEDISRLSIPAVKLRCRFSTTADNITPVLRCWGIKYESTNGVLGVLPVKKDVNMQNDSQVDNISLLPVGEIVSNKLEICPESGMVKVFKDTPLNNKAGLPLVIKAARGEYESAQLLLRPKAPMKIFEINATDLSGKDGRISKTNLCLRRAGYVTISRSSPGLPETHAARRAPAEYPDPLFDIEPFMLSATETYSIWITLRVPKGTPPGEYKGKINLITNYGEVAYPIIAKIWPFEIPDERHLEVFFWWCPWIDSPDNVHKWGPNALEKRLEIDGTNWLHQVETMANHLSQHRITMVRFNAVNAKVIKDVKGEITDFDFSALAAYIKAFEKGGIAKFANAAVLTKQASTNKVNDYQWRYPFAGDYLKALDKYVVKHNLSGRFYTSVADEPVNTDTVNHAKWASHIKELAPHIITLDATYSTNYPPKGMDCLALLPNTLDSAWEHYQKVAAAGTKLWLYTAWTPTGKYPNSQIDRKLIQSRTIWWLIWKYKLDGYLNCGLNAWHGLDVIDAPDMQYPAGSMYILYPSQDGKIVDSIRFENYRDGIEDYEYMWLLRDLCNKKGLPDKTKDLCNKIARSFTDYTQDPDELESIREKMAQEIMSLMEQ